MAIGVQTDMATPALAKFGSDDVRSAFPWVSKRVGPAVFSKVVMLMLESDFYVQVLQGTWWRAWASVRLPRALMLPR
jgi:hypothetical protein